MISKRFSRRMLVWIFFVMFLLWLGLNAILFLQLALNPDRLIAALPIVTVDTPAPEGVEKNNIEMFFRFAGYSAGTLLAGGLLLWLISRRVSMKYAAKPPETVEKAPQGRKEQPVEATSEHLYLHLLTVFQREGRLLDFFSEDLSLYADEQIGAAARAVHEGCRKAMEKHLTPVAVLNMEEGARYTVDSGFDPAKIKLTGNVTGDPPFAGIVRHRGWRAERIRIPKLAGDWDARILAPAEIEVV